MVLVGRGEGKNRHRENVAGDGPPVDECVGAARREDDRFARAERGGQVVPTGAEGQRPRLDGDEDRTGRRAEGEPCPRLQRELRHLHEDRTERHGHRDLHREGVRRGDRIGLAPVLGDRPRFDPHQVVGGPDDRRTGQGEAEERARPRPARHDPYGGPLLRDHDRLGVQDARGAGGAEAGERGEVARQRAVSVRRRDDGLQCRRVARAQYLVGGVIEAADDRSVGGLRGAGCGDEVDGGLGEGGGGPEEGERRHGGEEHRQEQRRRAVPADAARVGSRRCHLIAPGLFGTRLSRPTAIHPS